MTRHIMNGVQSSQEKTTWSSGNYLEIVGKVGFLSKSWDTVMEMHVFWKIALVKLR